MRFYLEIVLWTQKPCIVCYLCWMTCLAWYHQQRCTLAHLGNLCTRCSKKNLVWIHPTSRVQFGSRWGQSGWELWCIMSGGWARASVTNHSVSTWLVLNTAWCRKPWKRSSMMTSSFLTEPWKRTRVMITSLLTRAKLPWKRTRVQQVRVALP